jgi:hypothetical protein
MKNWFLITFLTLLVIADSMHARQAMAQRLDDSTYTTQKGVIDSLRFELKKIEKAYQLLRARTDSTGQLTEADKEELSKLSGSLQEIGTEISELYSGAADLANEAAKIYDVENADVKNGDYTLEDDEVSDRSLKVLNGNAFIYGVINGSLIVVNGDAFIRQGAKVRGDVIVVNGKAFMNNQASVDGEIVEREGTELAKRRLFIQKLRFTSHPDLWQNHDFLFEKVAVNYNRVEGLFLGVGSEKDYFWDGGDEISPYGFIGYAFSLHRWRYQVGLDKWFGNENRFELGLEGHSLTDSKDYWIIGPKENFVYSILAREDFMDYYSRQGASFHIAQYYEVNSRITLTYDIDKYSSLSRNTNWSIFGGDKVFRDNPIITEGWLRSIMVDVEHRNYSGEKARRGWIAGLHFETTLSGVSNFKVLSASVVRYQPLFRGLQMNMRFTAGTSSGDLPLQRSYQIGGFNTLNAFPYKEFSGNRLLLGNLELLLSPEMFKHSVFFPLNTFAILLIADAGEVQNAGAFVGIGGGWKTMRVSYLKSDYGVGIGSSDGNFRIFVAWRSDIATSPIFGVRLARPF